MVLVLEEYLKSLEDKGNVYNESTKNFRQDMLEDKLNNTISEHTKIANEIKLVTKMIEDTLNAREGPTHESLPSFNQWVQFRKNKKRIPIYYGKN